MSATSRPYVRAALASSWRSTTLVFWVVAAVLAVTVLALAYRSGDTSAPAPAVAVVPVFEMRSEALLVAADATRGVDVTAAAVALANRAAAYPASTELAAVARALAEGDASAADLAAAADRLLLDDDPAGPDPLP